MRMNNVVLRPARPSANLECAFDVLQLGTVSVEVQDIDLMPQDSKLLDLLHHECAGTLMPSVWIHGRDHKDFQAHKAVDANVCSRRPISVNAITVRLTPPRVLLSNHGLTPAMR